MNTTDIFSTQNTTTEAAEVGKLDLYDDHKQLYIDIEWWMNAISFIVFPVFGGFGNILTFIVMQRGSLKEISVCFYMSMLALSDTGKSKATDPFLENNIYFSCPEIVCFLYYFLKLGKLTVILLEN